MTMSDIIIPGFVVMALFAMVVAALYLPLLPHAIRNRRHKRQRVDLLFAIILFSIGAALILAWFAAAVVLRELNIPYARASDHAATLLLILMVIGGEGFFIRGATRLLMSATTCWALVIGGALGLWSIFYLILP